MFFMLAPTKTSLLALSDAVSGLNKMKNTSLKHNLNIFATGSKILAFANMLHLVSYGTYGYTPLNFSKQTIKSLGVKVSVKDSVKTPEESRESRSQSAVTISSLVFFSFEIPTISCQMELDSIV